MTPSPAACQRNGEPCPTPAPPHSSAGYSACQGVRAPSWGLGWSLPRPCAVTVLLARVTPSPFSIRHPPWHLLVFASVLAPHQAKNLLTPASVLLLSVVSLSCHC